MMHEQLLNTLPHAPGVYIYKNAEKNIIYIGKAVDLSKRVKQYFQREDAVGDKTPKLVAEIATIETIETSNEFEALLLEAKLIKQYQPKFNVISKDDKSPLYIALSIRDELPKVYYTRKPKNSVVENDQLFFGPFQSAKAAKDLLRSLRRVVPFCTQKQRTGRNCFYTHLGLCQPCPSYITKVEDTARKKKLTKEYRNHIFRLRDILSGKVVSVVTDMEKEMETAAEAVLFEEAASIRNQILALKSILNKRYDPQLYVQSDGLIEEIAGLELSELLQVLQPFYPSLQSLERIECFDISNTMGTNATASMVVMTGGRIDTSEYKRFKIKRLNGPNDFAMMQEVITRRFTHTEWKFPDLLVIDGGKGQVTSAKEALQIGNVNVPIIGLAKREEEIVVPYNDQWKIIRLPFSHAGLRLLQRLRDEAHRFAIRYHKFLRSKAM